ncbi:NO-inducible flavohemoprotein [Teichococcus oryzae]|uniref:nitric oxide dioxygenase n=1 Tax=Teichococcus oryzae TaxID=1608942 RepID=A0A5B2TCQ7_9PROT|nr:NO-inducible flavohemoprotein [Pseudoroseomonas oryzae]KAA2211864.1 NO-inducible flavohemoprotein [Pseudoroseomonas oryzae]
MPAPLSDATIQIIKATVPALEAHGLDITRAMYARLFQDPAIRGLFNQSHQGASDKQPRALAGAVLAYARNIDNLPALAGAVELIAQKHVSLDIQPEHYESVATALLGAIGEVLGEAATPEILAAWGEAYWFLAHLLIGREAEIYQAHEAAPGGWKGWRDFVVAERVAESAVITSFLLRPADGGKVMRHRPGEYLGLELTIAGQPPMRRNYSISSAPDDADYRISVRRDGLASCWLHDHAVAGTRLRVAAPAGDFMLRESGRPIVLLSGGVGQTPLLSMLEDLLARRPEAELHWVHGTLDGTTHAFGARLRELAARHPGLRVTTFYEVPRPQDRFGEDFDLAGRPSLAWLLSETPAREADIHLCGPRPFLGYFVPGLQAAGLAADQLHYEFFGPAEALQAA